MSQEVVETAGHSTAGFSSCCRDPENAAALAASCRQSGPTGTVGILTSYKAGYLFAQECNTADNKTGIVTEIYYGW